MQFARMRMESQQEVDVGMLVEQALEGVREPAPIPAAAELASIREADLARMEEAFGMGEQRATPVAGVVRG